MSSKSLVQLSKFNVRIKIEDQKVKFFVFIWSLPVGGLTVYGPLIHWAVLFLLKNKSGLYLSGNFSRIGPFNLWTKLWPLNIFEFPICQGCIYFWIFFWVWILCQDCKVLRCMWIIFLYRIVNMPHLMSTEKTCPTLKFNVRKDQWLDFWLFWVCTLSWDVYTRVSSIQHDNWIF